MRPTKTYRPRLETLEDRLLLATVLSSRAANITFQAGTISILGTNLADRATVTLEGTEVLVSLAGRNGKSARFRREEVNTVVFRGRGGNDRFLNLTDIPSIAYGDQGRDFLFGGTTNDLLYGGADNDLLVGGGGLDQLLGGPGKNRVLPSPPQNPTPTPAPSPTPAATAPPAPPAPVDTQSPTITVQSPTPGLLSSTNVTVTGRVTDDLAGVLLLQAALDAGGFFDVPFDADGLFNYTTPLALGGAADGNHSVRLRTLDRTGKFSPVTEVAFTLDSQGPTATFGLPSTVASTSASLPVVYSESVSAGAYSPATYSLVVVGGPNNGQSIPITSVGQENNTARLNLNTPLADGSYRLSIQSGLSDAAGNALTQPRTFDFTVADPAGIAELSPANGEELVSLTRETIVRFDEPVDPTTITPESFYLIANGERVAGTIRVSPTERFATFFYADPLPPSTEVRAVVDGNRIRARDGMLVDADGDNVPGGVGTADFRTLPLTFIPGTRKFGYVYDSYNRNPDGSNIPIEGVTIFLDADPRYFAVTDANGFFELGLQDVNGDGVADGLPAPEFFVHIDGSTAVNAPAGTVYATLGKPFHTVPGQRLQLEMPGGPDVNPDEPGEQFHVYLPPMAMGDVVPLNPDADTVVGFGAAGEAQIRAMFADDPAKAQLVIDTMRVTYPAGSAMDQDGVKATQATVIPVSPNRLPAPLPPGSNPQLVVSIQAGTAAGFNLAGGSTNFDVPAPVSFPNLEGLAPGEQVAIMSFDHDAGEWRSVGTGTVSADGRSIVSDPGVGILAPGWHFWDPLVDVFTHVTTFKNFNDLRALIAAYSDITTNIVSQVASKANPVATLGLGVADYYLTVQAAAPGGFTTNEAIGIAGGLLGIAVGAAQLGVAITGVGVGTAAVTWGLPILGAVAIGMSLWGDIDSIAGVVENAGRQLNGSDPPCDDIPPNSPPGDLLLAAALCLRDASSRLRAAQEDLETAIDGLTRSASALLTRGVNGRFGALASGATVRVMADGSVDLVDGVTGSPIIDPGNGEPLRARFEDLVTAGGLSQSEATALVQSVQSPSLQLVGNSLAAFSLGDVLQTLSGAAARIDAALVGLKRNRSGIFTAVGGIRLAANAAGVAHYRLAANSNFMLSSVDPVTGLIASQSFRTGGPGSVLRLPELCVDQFDLDDADGDGLGGIGEGILGTNPNKSDTDGDGLTDLAELRQGFDPLGGRLFPSGIIASLQLRGEARAVAVTGSTFDPARQTAFLATGSHGLAVVDASNFQNPTILGQLDLPGDASDVAVDPTTNVAVVAAGAGGLHFVDVSDPMVPRLNRTVRIDATQVEIIDGIAYAASGGRIHAYDAASGEVLTITPYGDTAAVNGMGHEGNTLFTLDANRKLRAFSRSGLSVTPRGSLDLPNGSGPVRVANGVAYLGAQGNVLTGGYVTVDVSNPDNLTLLSDTDVAGPFIAPGIAVVPNGSGKGLAVGRVGQAANVPVVAIVDLRDPTDTAAYETQFNLPGIPFDVAIASGIGYVASGTGGLQVVNYLSFDTQQTPPTNLTIIGPSGTTVDEGSRVSVRTTVTDDVQVRNVELLLNGQVVANDVSAPFELSALMPTLASGATTVTLQVRATDTGGNSALSNTLTYTLVEDMTPPVLLGSVPANNGAGFRVDAVTLRFSEAIDGAFVAPAGFNVTNLGGDFQVGGGDDFPVAVNSLEILPGNRVVVRFAESLPEGQYQLQVDPGVLRDLAGNSVTAPVITSFTSLDLDVANAVVWSSPTSGDWNEPLNWSTGAVPGPDDNVVIDVRASDITVTLSSGARTVRSLVSRESLLITGNTTSLTVLGLSGAEGPFELHNGATLIASGTTALFVATGEADIDGGRLQAENGASIQFPTVTSYTHTGGGVRDEVFLRATGVGSVLDLRNVTSITNGTTLSDRIRIEALSGGRVDLRAATQAVDPAGIDTRNRGIVLLAEGGNSQLNLASLAQITDASLDTGGLDLSYSLLTVRDGGLVNAPNLTSLQRVQLTLNGSGTLAVGQIAAFTEGRLILTGTASAFTNLRNANGTSFTLTAAAAVSFPILTDLDRAFFNLSGAGTSALLPSLAALTNGGLTLSGGATASVPMLANIDGSRLDVSGGVTLALPLVTGYEHTGGAVIHDEALLRASGVGSVLDLRNVTQITNGTSISDRIRIEALAGGRVDLRSATAILDPVTGDTRNRGAIVLADGNNSQIDFSALVQITDANLDTAGHDLSYSTLAVRNGGAILAPSLTGLQRVQLTLDGTGTLPVVQITTFTDGRLVLSQGSYSFSNLNSANGTTVTLAGAGSSMSFTSLSTVDRGKLEVNGSGASASLPTLTALTNGGLTLSGGATASVPMLANIDGSRLDVSGGVTLALPLVTGYEHTGGAVIHDEALLRASGVGSVLDLRNVTQITNGTSISDRIRIEALAGGRVDLRSATAILDPVTGDTRNRGAIVLADGNNSQIDFSALVQITDANLDTAGHDLSYSTLAVRNGGAILAPSLTGLQRVQLTLDGTGTLPVGQLVTVAESRLVLSGAAYTFANLSSANGTSVALAAAATAIFPMLTGLDRSVTTLNGAGVSASFPGLTSLTNGGLTLSGGATASVPMLANIDGSRLDVSGGVTLALPLVTGYEHTGGAVIHDEALLRASGVGSVLDLRNVTQITNGTSISDRIRIEALAGGRVDLRSATAILDPVTGDTRNRGAIVLADGNNSQIDFSALVQITDANLDTAGHDLSYSTLAVRNGGAILAPSLTGLQRVQLTLDGTGTLPVGQLVTVAESRLVLSGAAYTFTNLGNLNRTFVELTGGVTSSLFPSLAALTNGGLTLSGGATASVPMLANIDGSRLDVSGGVTLALPLVTGYEHTGGAVIHDEALLRASGVGSVLDLRNVTQITNGTSISDRIRIEALAGGRVDLRSATAILDPVTGDTRNRGAIVLADGNNSQIDFSALVQITDANLDTAGGNLSRSTVTARNLGRVIVNTTETFVTNTFVLTETLGQILGVITLGTGSLREDR